MNITFIPSGKIQQADTEENLLQVAQKAGLLLDTSCGGRGTCGKCKVKIVQGNPGNPDSIEINHISQKELSNGWRLACRLPITCDMTVQIPANDNINGRKQDMIQLPKDFIANIENMNKAQIPYGIAFDIGTTTVVGMLWDLRKGSLIHAASRTNPQSAYGADVISRVLFCQEEQGNLDIMQKMILECLNDIITELVDCTKIDYNEVGVCTIVGNTTMSHLLLGVDPISLATAPFSPGFYGPIEKKAAELSLKIDPGASVHVLPNIAGHVGSDIVAVLLASGLAEMDGANLAVDIGTNGEILFSYNGRTLTCSTAAGPAFEGASIYCGMRATKGAIDSIKIHKDNIVLTTVGQATPVGICGSGLIQCVAELLNSGMLTKTGKFATDDECKNKGLTVQLLKNLRNGDRGREFVLYDGKGASRDVVITQKDIREVQLAKAAISAGIKILIKELGLDESQINSILLAGAFGNYIDTDSALRIGLLPTLQNEKVLSIGNAAGTGGSMALLSTLHLKLSYKLAEQTEHIELASHPDFQTIYLKEMYFVD